MNSSNSAAEAVAGRPFFRRFLQARNRAVLQALMLHAPAELARMVADLDWELDPEFAVEIERVLNANGYSHLLHSRTLMPAMLERFGVTPDAEDRQQARELRQLDRVCAGCPVAGRCWRALRSGEGVEVCRTFCPNAEAFDRMT